MYVCVCVFARARACVCRPFPATPLCSSSTRETAQKETNNRKAQPNNAVAHLSGFHVQPVHTATQVVEAVTHVDDGVPVAEPGLWHVLWLRQQRH